MISRRAVTLSPVAFLWPAQAFADADLVLPLDLSGPRPTVQLSMRGGAPETWLFDTGAGGAVVDIERARAWALPELGLAQVGSPAGGTPVQGFTTTINGAMVGQTALPEFAAVAAPTPPQLNIAGVLSPYIFSGRLVTFDFPHSQVRVSDRSNAPSGEPIPYNGDRHPLPGIQVSIGERTFLAHIDTGAPHAIAFPYAMASLLPLAAAPEQTGVARFVDGEHARYRAQIVGDMRVGPLTVSNAEIALIDGLPDVNVGTQLLRRMVVTLDPERRVSWAVAAG